MTHRSLVRNTRGQFTKGNRARALAKASRPAGVTGVTAFSGYVSGGEDNADLSGAQKHLTYANAINKPIVATGIRYFSNLLAGTDWHCDPNPAASAAEAARAEEIINEGLLSSAMLKPWPSIVRKAALFRILGFSIHATAMRRRKDGLIVYSAIEHRPQHTIEKWLRDAEDEPFHTAVQRSKQSGKEIPLPLDECFYCVDDTVTDSPEGVGLLRHVVEYVRRLDLFEGWEGKAYGEDLAGIPYTRAPLADLAGSTGTADERLASVMTGTQTVRDFMDKRYKSEDTTPWLMLDSSTYENPDGTLSGEPKWSFERIKTETANLDRLDATMKRVELQIARVLGVEWALMGADGAGSYAQHEDKTSMFATNLQTTLTELGWFATHQLARRLIARNGLDPDTCTPRLVAEPISTDAVLTVTQALANLTTAGLMPDDPAINVLRKRMRLPPAPERMAHEAYSAPRGPQMPPPEADPTGADGSEDAPEQDAETDTQEKDQ